MSRLIRRAMLAPVGVSAGKTYDEWLAHTATRAPTIVDETSLASALVSTNTTVLRRVQMGTSTASGTLLGTPFWGADESEGIFGNSRIQRVFQQALPSQAQYNEQKASSRIILVEVVRTTNGSDPFVVSGVDRNGLSSSTYNVTTGSPVWQIGGGSDGAQGQGASVGVSYWDAALNKPMSFFPRAKSVAYGPFDYAAAGW